ncbi:hypothetical protein Tco_0079281 [Tanacetum coccineum]
MMSTLVFVNPEISTQDNGAQTSRVPVPLPDDPYVAVRQASTPLACLVEESEDSDTSGVRSTSSDSTAPLSPDHPLTCTSPTPTPTYASFHRRTARITMRAQPIMSPGHSARVTEAMALLDSAFRKRYRYSYKTPSSSSSLAFPVWKRYRATSELILDTDSEEDEIRDKDTDEDEGHGLDDKDHSLDDEGHGLDDKDHSLDDEGHSLDEEGLGLEGSKEEGYGALRRRELAVEEDQVYNTFEVGQGFGFLPEPERPKRVLALRQPTLTTWIDPEDGIAYIDVPAYLPPAPPAQTPPSPEWSSGSLPVSPAPSVIPSPIPSRMISLTVPSPIASPVATSTATISVDEDQFIKVGAQLKLYGSILHDHTQRLDAMPLTLFAGIDRDVRELYTRSGVVRDEIFSQRPVLALEAWAGHVDTQMADLSRAGYDDHRLIHDMSLGESEEIPLEETNSLEGQCIELGNGISLWMIVVEDSS